jgi:hypothetical protein
MKEWIILTLEISETKGICHVKVKGLEPVVVFPIPR